MFDKLFEKINAINEIEVRLSYLHETKSWEKIALALYQILDDIDTADDMFKEDTKGFREFVMKKQQEKNRYPTSNGFEVSKVNECVCHIYGMKDDELLKFYKGMDASYKKHGAFKTLPVDKKEVEVEIRKRGLSPAIESITSRQWNQTKNKLKTHANIIRGSTEEELPAKIVNLEDDLYKILGESLVPFAQKELQLAGLFDNDSDYEGMVGEAVMELIQTFARQEHSGCSASITREIFDKLANFKPLTELTNNPDEWMEVAEGQKPVTPTGEGKLWQSKRSPSCFSEDGGKTYYDLDEMEGDSKRVIHTSKLYQKEK